MKVLQRVVSVLCVVVLLVPTFASAELAPVTITALELCPLIADIIEDSYDDYEIKYSESMITVYVAINGLANKLQAAYEAGEDENYAPWVEYKNSLHTTYTSIASLLSTCGRSDIYLQLWLLNDASRNGQRSRFISNLAYAYDDGVIDHAMDHWEDEPIVIDMPDDIAAIHSGLVTALQEGNFDYCSVLYNEKLNRFNIEIAINGIGEELYKAKQRGYDETWDTWVETKVFCKLIYKIIRDELDAIGRSDIGIDFRLVNDEVQVRKYYDRIDFDPLYWLSNGIVLDDIMEY